MKKLIILFIFLTVVNEVSSQSNAGLFDWAFNAGAGANTTKRLQYNSSGDLICMITITDTTYFGNTLLGGNAFGAYPGNVTFIGKRTQAGVKSVILRNSPSTLTTGTFNDFALDANDNIIVSGSVFNATTPYDFGNGVTLLGKGFFVAKYDASGLCLWAKLYDFNIANFYATTTPISLGVLPNNDIYFAAMAPVGGNIFWLARINPSGTEVWHKEWILNSGLGSIGTSKNNCFFDNNGTAYFYVSLLQGGNLIVNNDTLIAPPVGHPSNVFILSIDAQGNNKLMTAHKGGIGDIAVEKATGNLFVKWSQYVQNPPPFNTINFNVNNQYQGIVVVDSNRNYIKSTAGSFLQGAEIDAILPLGDLKFVGNGLVYPTETIIAGTQSFTAITHTPVWKFFDSNFVFTSFVAHPFTVNTSSGDNIYMAKYANKLAVCGEYLLANNTTVDVNGTILITCEHDLNFGAKFPSFASLAGDLFIGQFNIGATPTSISSTNKIIQTCTVYPNPTKGSFTIQLQHISNNSQIEIIDVTGKEIYKQKTEKSIFTIDHNLIPGVYFIRIKENQLYTASQKIVILQ
jgi:hypothetical protein